MQIQSFLSDPVTRENHSMLLQLVATMGHIISACEAWFREEGMSTLLRCCSCRWDETVSLNCGL
jgi:hypothetical protein